MRRDTGVAVALLAAALAGGCTGGGRRVHGERPPVVLVSIDTLRADHLPAYGHRGLATPAIDALRADGVLYADAWSHYPLTLPSHASILTGLLPPDHGVRDNSGYRLAADLPYLPRDLRAAGYATGGAVSAFVLRGASGLEDGFDLYDDAIPLHARTGLGGQQRPGETTWRAVRGWLREHAGGPFFLFLHLYEPHSPYRPPEPFASRYRDAPYDGEIAAADRVVGELVAELRRLGAYDRALVVLLSDHGEGLGDHGEAEHGVLLYREDLHVPLILKLPRGERAGTTVSAPVGLVDVYPTVAALAGLPPPPRTDGVSLLAAAPGPGARRLYAETFYPRLHFGWSELTSVTDGRFHYLGGPRPELFDLAADPGERRDVLRDHRRILAGLRAEAARRAAPLAAPGSVDAATRRRLAALGYAAGAADPGDGPLPDPRQHLAALGDLEHGMALAAQDRFAPAVEVLSGLVQREPRMVDAWETLGRAWQGLGEPERALAAYGEALSRSRSAPQIALAAAGLLLETRRPREAAEHARLALDTDPVAARQVLARAALATGDLETAEREARRAVAERDGDPGPLLVWAEVQRERGDLAGALAAVEKADAELAALPGGGGDRRRGLELLRGGVLARMGRAAEAEAAFRREIRADPAHPRAYTELALLLALQGRSADAVGVLRALVESHPTPGAYAAAVRTLRVLGDPRAAEGLRRHALARYPDSPVLAAAAGGGA